jgi:hypothetical protein
MSIIAPIRTGRAKNGYVWLLICGHCDAGKSAALTDMANDDIIRNVLLDLISTSRPVTPTRLQALSAADWQSICTIAKQHRLGPMLHHRIEVLGLSGEVLASVFDKWATAYRKAAFRYLSLRKALARISTILETAQIPFAALKGAWLSQYAYDDPVLRPMRDIDILVDPNAALAVYKLLENNGFARDDNSSMPLDIALHHWKHLPAMRCSESGLHIEVHMRLVPLPPDPDVRLTLNDVPLLLARREYRHGVPYLSPTDTLLHLIVHAAYDHQFNNGPLTFNDIACLLDRAPVDWPVFWAMAREGNWERGCLLILELASFYHGAEVWRAFYDNTISGPSHVQRQSAALLSLQEFDHRGLLALNASIAHISGGWGKVRLLFSRAFPSLHRLAAFSGAKSTTYWASLHYPHWLFAQLKRLSNLKAGAQISPDASRAAQVRTWMRDDANSAFD